MSSLKNVEKSVLRQVTSELLQFVSKAALLSYDIESTGINTRKDQIIGFSISDGKQAFYVVHQEWVDGQLKQVVPKTKCAAILHLLANKQLIMHNAAFDVSITKQYFNVDLLTALHADTMLMAHTTNENLFNYGLKELGAAVFGVEQKEEQTALKEHLKAQGADSREFYKANAEVLGQYAAQDAALTYALYEHYYPLLERDELLPFFFKDEVMPLYKLVTIPMMQKGIPVDLPYLQSTQAEMNDIMGKLEDEIQEHIAPLLGPFKAWYLERHYNFLINEARFKQKLGEFIAPALWPKTETGQLSFNAADIKKAKTHNKKELKSGSNRPLLGPSKFEDYITGEERCPKDLQIKCQLGLIADEGIKYPFNILSKDHLKRLFFGNTTTKSLLNESPLSTTDKGAPQIDDDFLQHVSGKYVWVPLLQRYNSLTKIKSTYVDRFLEEQENGIFYPSFFQHRTTSGRYGSDIQQMPRIKSEEEVSDPIVREYTNRIRSFFVSGDNRKIISADYSSLEVVVFANDAGDDKLLNIIRNREDFYSRVAIEVYGLTEYSSDKKAENFLKKHKPEVRQAAKSFALGIRYGLESYKLHKDLNISQDAAERIIDSYFKQFPMLRSRMDELRESAIRTGKVRSKGGRLRRLPEIPDMLNKWGHSIFNSLELWKEYNDTEVYDAAKQQSRLMRNLLNNALNFPIQSYAATIVNRASIELAKKFKELKLDAYIALNIHDEIVVICDKKQVDEVCYNMKYCMENTIKLSVPLEADPVVGDRYSEVK